jgi:nicotinamidase-related amidase
MLREAFGVGAVANLVIDVQALYCDPTFPLAWPQQMMRVVQDSLDSISSFARLVRGPAKTYWVSHRAHLSPLDLDIPSYRSMKMLFDIHCRGRRDEIQELKKRAATLIYPAHSEHDSVVYKPRFSAFDGTGLAETLEEDGTKMILLSGFYREDCVLETAKSAIAHQLVPVLIEDLAPWVRRAPHEMQHDSDARIAKCGVRFLKSDDVMGILRP